MDPLEIQFNAFAETFQILETIELVFLVALCSETLWDVATKQRKRLGQTFANFAIALGNAFLERTAYGLIFVVGLVLAGPFAFFEIPYRWWSWGLAFIAADFTYYWMHRLEHEIRFLWAHHSVHHSSEEFNFSTALRLAWIEAVFEWVFFVPMILVGFDIVQTVIAFLMVVVYQSWLHTEKIGKLGWLDKIFNTPSVHRVHHGKNPQYIDKNYGGVLIIWDRLFGTYEPEGDKVLYGITTPINSNNPITINFHEYQQIAKDIRRANSLRDSFKYLFDRPGWSPSGTDKSTKIMKHSKGDIS